MASGPSSVQQRPALQTERGACRRIGTTYAYDFLGLLEKALVQEWQSAIAAGTATSMPADLLVAGELLEDGDTVAPGERRLRSASQSVPGRAAAAAAAAGAAMRPRALGRC